MGAPRRSRCAAATASAARSGGRCANWRAMSLPRRTSAGDRRRHARLRRGPVTGGLGDGAVAAGVGHPDLDGGDLVPGQLVAQSEFSVVTTLAPVTGWWKVV